MQNKFEVCEIFTENNELISLSLGFESHDDPYDILHIVSGKSLSNSTPKPLEDNLYLERTDQSLSCTGEVVSIKVENQLIKIEFTEVGSLSLGFDRVVEFSFSDFPEFFERAVNSLKLIASVGHQEIILQQPLINP